MLETTTYTCSVCGASFSVPADTLARFPNWIPKYCYKHSPKRSAAKKVKEGQHRKNNELDLPLREVLERFHKGPETGVFTDGSARPNPGPGGWGVVYVEDGKILAQKHGSQPETTNNRMELTALIEGYKMINPKTEIDVYTDSELCCNIINKWAAGWEKRGWKRKDGQIKNLELVQELYALAKSRPLARLRWIKAHNGWRWNEYADSLATAWARSEL